MKKAAMNRKGKLSKTCSCGKVFQFCACLKDRKKFCCKKCFYKFRSRPSGLVYVLKKENPTSFKKGLTPWNKGIKTGIVPYSFKSEGVGYDALHDWVKRHRGKAAMCQKCGSERFVQWANKSHKYTRDLSDWLELCRRCHIRYDREANAWGLATKIFNLGK